MNRARSEGLDTLLGERFKVLDDGFIVAVDYMGSDASIERAARVSYGEGTRAVSDRKTLLRYLMRHRHTTPFEMCELTLHVRVPMDTWRQWIRHRTASVNEYCLAPGTRVLCADLTWTPVESCQVGDLLVGFNEEPLRLRRNRFGATAVTATKRLELESKQVVMKHGAVTASDGHLWVARRQAREPYRWTRTDELRPGWEVAFMVRPWEGRHDYDAGWLAGIFDGEGWFSHDGDRSFHVGFAQNEGAVLDKAKSLLSEYAIPFISFPQMSRHNRTMTVSVSRKYDALRLLATVRPVRLLDKCLSVWMGAGRVTAYPSQVLDVRDVGVQPVIAIGTDRKTLIAEGFLSHNSTRYSEAIDSMAKTQPHGWRAQSTTNKQGSGDGKIAWPKETSHSPHDPFKANAGSWLSEAEDAFHHEARAMYEERLKFGVAREQARKDLPLSTYTEAYWKIDAHNLMHFLSLRMDSHAQYEIRLYANAIYQIFEAWLPITAAAFADYRLGAVTFSRDEQEAFKQAINVATLFVNEDVFPTKREYDEFIAKLNQLGLRG